MTVAIEKKPNGILISATTPENEKYPIQCSYLNLQGVVFSDRLDCTKITSLIQPTHDGARSEVTLRTARPIVLQAALRRSSNGVFHVRVMEEPNEIIKAFREVRQIVKKVSRSEYLLPALPVVRRQSYISRIIENIRHRLQAA